jgi:hypothetical protein
MPDQFDIATDDLRDIELAAAIIEDSCGYAAYPHAMRHVREYRAGDKETYCERASSCFDNDLEQLIERAADYWRRQLASDTKQARDLLAYARARAAAWDDPDDPGEQAVAALEQSMAYPVGGI